jgi:hypothetical protein
MLRLFGVALVGAISLALVGCGGSKTIPTATYSPDSSATEAMAMYDANKDGKLDAAELKKCPGLADNLAEIDTDGDKSINQAEIAARIKSYVDSGTRLRDVTPRVVRSNRPIAGVTVTLEPEKFMGGAIKPATGVSTETGDVPLQTEGQPFTGAQIGFFRVVVSQKGAGGKEMAPAKFNNPTTLSVEIGPSNRPNLVIDLDK